MSVTNVGYSFIELCMGLGIIWRILKSQDVLEALTILGNYFLASWLAQKFLW